jgi:hypothetical protein
LNIVRMIYSYYLTEFPLLINSYIQKIVLAVNNNIINCIYYIILLITQIFILIAFLLFIYNTLLHLIKWLINNKDMIGGKQLTK